MTYTLTVSKSGIVQLPTELLLQQQLVFVRQHDNTYKVTVDGISTELQDQNIEYTEDETGIEVVFKKGVRAGKLLDHLQKNV
jgi:hypothetical protein